MIDLDKSRFKNLQLDVLAPLPRFPPLFALETESEKHGGVADLAETTAAIDFATICSANADVWKLVRIGCSVESGSARF